MLCLSPEGRDKWDSHIKVPNELVERLPLTDSDDRRTLAQVGAEWWVVCRWIVSGWVGGGLCEGWVSRWVDKLRWSWWPGGGVRLLGNGSPAGT